jgi:hypothetical protein
VQPQLTRAYGIVHAHHLPAAALLLRFGLLTNATAAASRCFRCCRCHAARDRALRLLLRALLLLCR